MEMRIKSFVVFLGIVIILSSLTSAGIISNLLTPSKFIEERADLPKGSGLVEINSEKIKGATYKVGYGNDVTIYTKARAESYCDRDKDSGRVYCEIPITIIDDGERKSLPIKTMLKGLEGYDYELEYSNEFDIETVVEDLSEYNCSKEVECMTGKDRKFGDSMCLDSRIDNAVDKEQSESDGYKCDLVEDKIQKTKVRNFVNYKPIENSLDLSKPNSILIKLNTTDKDRLQFNVSLQNGFTKSKLTQIDPTLGISTCQDLQDIQLDTSSSYYLTNDIDCQGFDWEPISAFSSSSTLDGNGYRISNLYFENFSRDNVGMFGQSNGFIKNIAFYNITIRGNQRVGAIVGYQPDGWTRNVSVRQSEINGSSLYLGIVSGYKSGSDSVDYLSDIYTENVRAESTSCYTGGITGVNYNPIYRVWTNASMGGFSGIKDYACSAGGITGRMYEYKINNTISYALVNGNSGQSGSITGYVAYATSTVYDSAGNEPNVQYGNMIGNCASAGACGAPNVIDNFTAYSDYYNNDTALAYGSWDFDSVWLKTDALPILRMELPEVTLVNPNESFYDSGEIDLNFTSKGAFGIEACWYSLDGGITNTTLPDCNDTHLSLDNGDYDLFVYANDSEGYEAYDSQSFDVDNSTINLDIIYSESTIYTERNLFINVTANVTCLANDCGNINTSIQRLGSNLPEDSGSPFYVNDSNPNVTSLNAGESMLINFWINATGTYGSYNVNFFSFKESQTSVENTTANINIQIVEAPLVTIQNPQNITYAGDSNDVNFTVNPRGSTTDECWYSLDGSANISITSCEDFQLTGLSHGLHSIIISANTTFGLENSSEIRYWTNDLSTINLDLVSPTVGGNFVRTKQLWFNVTVNVTCLGADCGEVNVSLDPPAEYHIISELFPTASATDISWNYIMGYRFRPNKDTYVVSFKKYDDHTKTVKLYDSTYTELATESISGSPNSWGSDFEIDTPVKLISGQDYFVVVCYQGSGGAYKTSSGYPRTHNDMYIYESVYQSTSGCTFTGQYSYAGNAYGLVDIGLKDSIGDEKDGLILQDDTARPFYTNNTNPRTITLNEGDSELVTFWVRPVGDTSVNYTFFAYANKTSFESIGNITGIWNESITSCNYHGNTSLNWDIDCPENCTIDEPEPIDTNISFEGEGIQTIVSDIIKNQDNLLIKDNNCGIIKS